MRDIRPAGPLLPGFTIMCVTALTACTGVTDAADDAFDSEAVDAIGDKVADWQLANLDDLSYIRSAPGIDNSDRRGWQHGALYVGMMNWAALQGNEKYFEPMKQIGEENRWQLGARLFHGDDHVVGQMYLAFYEREKAPSMISHTVAQFNQILAADPDGSLEFLGSHIRGVGRECQLRWCWCDALFMSPPTWMQLSLATGEQRYMDYADREFWATHDYLLDPEYNLFYRDSRFFTRRDEAGNKIFWSRGNGWVYAGLVNILKILPENHPNRPNYVQLYRDMSATIAGLQHPSGLWSPSLLSEDPDPTPETSGSAFMTYGLAWGLNNELLDSETYEPVVRKGWLALVNAVSDDGKLGWVQPVGSQPESVFASDSHLYGVGAFLLAASQMLQFE